MSLPKKMMIDVVTGRIEIVEMTQQEFDDMENAARQADAIAAAVERPPDRISELEKEVKNLKAIISEIKEGSP